MINSVDKPDLDSFPRFAKAAPITTQMLTPSISLSINTVNQSNWHELVNFVATGQRSPFVSIASRV